MTRKKTGNAGKIKRGWRTARNSDRYELYELAVQDAEVEVDFIDKVWRERRRRLARTVREDFCGTAITAIEWVRRRRDNRAIGVDLDQKVLAWARTRLPQRLSPGQCERLSLLRADVRTVRTTPPLVDCILASNFSYFIFKSRDELRQYFAHAHAGLVSDGVLLLDAYGGSESFDEMEEESDMDGFTYVWDQALYNPITGEVVNHIHFRFPDGSEMKKAFSYDWRLWTLPEIQELLLEAGFVNVTVYWEGTDRATGEGNGRWRPSRRGEACAGWVAYLVAEK